MQKHERMALAMVEERVTPLGLTATFGPGKRHGAIRVEGQGRFTKLSVSGSPGSIDNAINNTRQALTRWLKQEGLT
jgi:hypothetical protein